MGALIYVLIVFAATLVLFWIEAFSGLHVSWVLGVLLSYPAFWMLCRSLWLITLEIWGKRTDGEVIAVRGRSSHILKVQYQDEEGGLHETEETAIYGIMRRIHPPEKSNGPLFSEISKSDFFWLENVDLLADVGYVLECVYNSVLEWFYRVGSVDVLNKNIPILDIKEAKPPN